MRDGKHIGYLNIFKVILSASRSILHETIGRNHRKNSWRSKIRTEVKLVI